RSCLRRGGVLIPSRLELEICPVRLPDFRANRRFWESRIHGLPLTPFAREWSAQPQLLDYESFELLGPWTQLCLLGLDCLPRHPFECTCRFTLGRSGRIDGFLGAFRAELYSGVILEGARPGGSSHWATIFMPLEIAVRGTRGDIYQFSFSGGERPEEGDWKW